MLKRVRNEIGFGVRVKLSTEDGMSYWWLTISAPKQDIPIGLEEEILWSRGGALEFIMDRLCDEIPRLRERLEKRADDRRERERIEQIVRGILDGMGIVVGSGGACDGGACDGGDVKSEEER